MRSIPDVALRRWSDDLRATEDWAAVVTTVARREAELRDLPEPTWRSPTQRYVAEQAWNEVRGARARFIDRYTPWIYSGLTDDGANPLSLRQLLDGVRRTLPDLVASADQLRADAGREQRAKEGFEVDDALLIAAFLATPSSGLHLLRAARQPTARARHLLDEFTATGRCTLHSARLQRRGCVGHLTMTGVDCLNAEDAAQVADMETLVDLVLLDPQTSVGVLRGAVMEHPTYRGRRVFSAGINLKKLHRGSIPLVAFLLQREFGYVSKLMHGLAPLPEAGGAPHTSKPWVAAVDTFAIGGGMQLALVADHVIAGTDAYFSLPAAQEGIVPGAAGLRLTRAVGSRVARQIILGGRKIHADESDARGLVDQAVAPDLVGDAVQSAAAQLAAPAVRANRRILNLAEEPADQLRAYLCEFATTQAERLSSSDVAAKAAAFTGRS